MCACVCVFCLHQLGSSKDDCVVTASRAWESPPPFPPLSFSLTPHSSDVMWEGIDGWRGLMRNTHTHAQIWFVFVNYGVLMLNTVADPERKVRPTSY